MANRTHAEEFTPEQLRQYDARWKSDFERKLDDIARRIEDRRAETDRRFDALQVGFDRLATSIDALNDVLSIGKGGMAFLLITAKVMAAIGIIAASIYALKEWVIR